MTTRAYWITDSYGNLNGADSAPYIASALLGWTPTVDAIGGTCYQGANNFGSRVPAAIAASPDIAIILGSVNDRWATVLGDVTGALSVLAASVPIVYAGLMSGSNGVVAGNSWGSAVLGPTRDLIAAAALAVGVTFIDGIAWITGTGYAGHPEGDGNADLFVVADGVHHTLAGDLFLGGRLAAAIVPATSFGRIATEVGKVIALEGGSGKLGPES